MSNLEREPRETPCGGAVATLPRPPAATVLEPREVPLGGPRALLVRRTLPHREIRTVGAWCFVDHYGPERVSPARGMHVPPHPHTGLQTVSWLLAGEILHRDSLGSLQLIRPGELNLMTAGQGIAHSEETPAGHHGTLEGVQLWVALPDAARNGARFFDSYAGLPVLRDGALSATVVMGSLGDVHAPARTFTPLLGADIALSPGAAGRLPLEAEYEHAVLVLSDALEVDGRPVPHGHLLHLGRGRRDLALAHTGSDGAGAGAGGAGGHRGRVGGRALLLGGTPFEEPLLMWWNFVGRDHDEIAAARDDWERERTTPPAGVRFGEVRGYAGVALPAPAMPGTRLRPRANPSA